MNKYFLLNPEKNLVQIRLVVFEINARRIFANFFQDLGENTSSSQLVGKGTAPGL